MRRVIHVCTLASAALGAVVVLVVVAWLFDASRHEGHVARNVVLAGRPVGGLPRAELRPVVDTLNERFRTGHVQVKAPGGGFTSTTEALGVRLSPDDTERAVLRVGRTGNAAARLWGWTVGLVKPRPAPVRITVHAPSVYATVTARDPGPRTPPEEPKVAFVRGAFVAVPGKPGQGIDAADVIRALPKASREGVPVVVEVPRGKVAPRWSLAEAERVAGEAQARVSSPLPIAAGSASATVPVDTVRTWVTSEATDAGLRLSIDEAAAMREVERRLAGAGERPVDARFTVVDGTVQVIAGRDGSVCCDPGAARLVADRVLGSGTGTVRLPLRVQRPRVTTEQANRLGVHEAVATFTTPFKAGQPRVRNIHHIADVVRGQVILPGETFSVNEFVGPRTASKGFVSAPVIEEGRFSEGVGGGVSQFATTLFNAAFFAGLDFVEYQSHSIYISRYPYGREATLNFPKPDLRLRNPSPHGVLIWPTYDEKSITVTLYSTKWVEAAQTAQSRASVGPCTRVTTERTRRYVADGRAETDRVFALYRPAEGVNC